ncbi:unnamed protein product [Durusdinium trenchii]|uniref:Smr domain-containing protein n=1 Tax=Durusdinium trenchii TaxID=1381693 RepID=A0ABP0Q9T7_9DINO
MALGRWISLLSLPATWAAWVSLSDLQGDLSPDPVEKAEASPPSPAPEVLEATEFLQRHSRELEENHVNLSALLSLERLDPNDPNTPKGPTQEELAEVDQASGGRSRAILAKAFALAKRIRSHEGNLVASVVNVVNPDNCLTKLLYLLYRFEKEDDFPYLPRKLGSCDIGFNFQMGEVTGRQKRREHLSLHHHADVRLATADLRCVGFAPSYSGVVPAPHPSDGLYWLGLRHGRMGRPGLSHARRLRRAWRLGSQQGAESVWSPGGRGEAKENGAGAVRLLFAQEELQALGSSEETQWREALRHLREAKPLEVRYWGAGIGACARHHLWTLALQLLVEMRQKEAVQPNIVCFNAAMAACERAFAWTGQTGVRSGVHSRTQALELFSQAFELKMANVVSFSTAVMAARSGSHGWQAALHLLQLSLQGGHANAFVFTAAIQACGLGSWRHALGVLEAMRGLSSVQVDSTALNACVTACERAEGWAQAVELFEAMESFQVSKEVISFNAAIAAWRGHWPQALRLMKELRSAALVPSVVTWNSCISAAEKASEWQMALQMLQELKDEGRPSVVSFNAVLSACERRGAWRWALQVLEDMPRSAVKPDAGSYGAVLTAVGREAVWWETALELLQQAWDSARDSSMSRKELLERAIVAVMRAGRLPEAVCLYREAQVLGLCAPSRGPDLLDLHDLALEAALAAVCERLLAGVDTGELVLITGRASHSREGSASMKEALVHFLDSELGLATGEVPGNPGRLHVSLPVEFQGPGRLQQRERKSQKKCGRHPSLGS